MNDEATALRPAFDGIVRPWARLAEALHVHRHAVYLATGVVVSALVAFGTHVVDAAAESTVHEGPGLPPWEHRTFFGLLALTILSTVLTNTVLLLHPERGLVGAQAASRRSGFARFLTTLVSIHVAVAHWVALLVITGFVAALLIQGLSVNR